MSTQERRNPLFNKVLCRVVWVMMAASAAATSASAEEDPYLSAIAEEAEKVESEGLPTVTESDTPADKAQDDLDMQLFEEDLKTRYKGSYTFYRKLPKRTREEVFVEYREGASMDEIRKKIMDRFLNQ